jgi:predicted PurR-regulated permease PerM
MAFPDGRTLNILLTTLLVALVCLAAYEARRILLIFVLAIFFAYLLDPVVKFLQGHSLFFRNVRGSAVVEVYIAFLILIALLGYEFAPGVARKVTRLVDEVPVLLDGLSTGEIATDLGGKYGWTDAQEHRFKEFLLRHRENIKDLVKVTDRYLSNAAEVLACLLLIPVLALFFLRDGDRIADGLIKILSPTNKRDAVRAVAVQLNVMVTKYIRAQVILCGLSLLFYLTASLLLKFPHAPAFAIMGGALEFIPIFGWMTIAAAIISVGIVNHLHWIWMAVFLGVWRIAQDYYIGPRIMGRQLRIHPLAAIFAVLVGAEIGGITGIYLAIPLIACLGVIWRMYTTPEKARGLVESSRKLDGQNWLSGEEEPKRINVVYTAAGNTPV